MKTKELKTKFNQAVASMPEELLAKGEQEVTPFKMQVNWPGGTMCFTDNRGTGEFALHVYKAANDHKFYQEYPVFANDGSVDQATLNDLVDDLVTNAAHLTLEDKVVYLSGQE